MLTVRVVPWQACWRLAFGEPPEFGENLALFVVHCRAWGRYGVDDQAVGRGLEHRHEGIAVGAFAAQRDDRS